MASCNHLDSEFTLTPGCSERLSIRSKVFVPELLPVPNLSQPNDFLCDTCTSLKLTPRRFVVLPEDGENEIKQDILNIHLGLVKDIKNKTYCPFCRLVLKAQFRNDVVEVEDGLPVEILMSWNTDGPRVDPDRQPWNYIPQIRILRVYAQKVGGGMVDVFKINTSCQITLLANDAPTPSKSFFARLIKDQIDFEMVKNWLAMCSEGHGEYCNQSGMLNHQIEDPAKEIPFFRVIDVIDNCIVLAPPKCIYVTLSYVWGKIDISTILRLLKANVQDLAQPGALLREEHLKKIPVTIRDACEVVRRLGLRYMWTDSLCIIQDDVGEVNSTKAVCIAKMNLVYGAAYLTIIAATGIDANAGLPGLNPGTRGTTQPIEEISPGFRLAFKPRSGDRILSSVYSTRAWTFQEKKFAKRHLTFIGGQVIFGCQKVKLDPEWREDVVFEDRHSEGHPVLGGAGGKDIDDIRELEWSLGDYTGLSLTYRGDIYHAFAGMIRYLRGELGVDLVHGIPDKYFDWFLLWGALDPQTRLADAPSWSWSGWKGESFPRIWDWYNRSIAKIRAAQTKRTWIIWYQRKAHDSEDCIPIWSPNADSASPSHGRANRHRGEGVKRFPFDCTRTAPTPRLLSGAPKYIEDTYNPSPGSGFLQFWTVSAMFKLNAPISPAPQFSANMRSGYTRLGIFGSSASEEFGIIYVHPYWCKKNPVPTTHEFILICEGRDERAQNGTFDEEPGWRYMAMLIEWHGEWAERVAVGWIRKEHVVNAVGNGPVWKELVLG